MWIWIAPILLSYVVFVYIGEHINPFRKFREVTARRRIESGRRAALIALPLFFVLTYGSQYFWKYVDDSELSDDFVATLVTDTATDTDTDPSNKEVEPSEGTVVSDNTPDSDNTTDSDNVAANEENQLVDSVVVKPAFAPSSKAQALKAAEWINAQEPRTYTIQLNASKDLASVELFSKQSALPEPNVIFPFERNGSTWYALVHGAFNSFANASASMEQLPEQVQFHTPWIRSIEKLQEIVVSSN